MSFNSIVGGLEDGEDVLLLLEGVEGGLRRSEVEVEGEEVKEEGEEEDGVLRVESVVLGAVLLGGGVDVCLVTCSEREAGEIGCLSVSSVCVVEIGLSIVEGDETAVLVGGGFSRANLRKPRFELESVIEEIEGDEVM